MSNDKAIEQLKERMEKDKEAIMNIYMERSLPGESYSSFLKRMGYIRQEPVADTRYNIPKEAPKSTYHDIFEAIQSNPIYREVSERIGEASYDRAKQTIIMAQHKQVGYGLDKYPETLNGNSWTAVETVDHIIEETIDKLHYLVMLQHKLKQQEEENKRKGLSPL